MSERDKGERAARLKLAEHEPAKHSCVLELVQTVAELDAWRSRIIANQQKTGQKSSASPTPSFGLVPTMGALHAGHMALIERARRECNFVTVSIFVNPLQFGPNEDYTRYPRTLEADLKLLRQAGVDCVFNPSVDELYPDRSPEVPTTMVVPPQSLINRLCGVFRPGHFEGVATVVTKLLNIVRPDVAYFGEKDFQQLLVVKKLVHDLNMKVEIRPVPIVREADGLALSSRNVYLTETERALAPLIHRTLQDAADSIFSGSASVNEALQLAEAKLRQAGFDVQYLSACNYQTLEFIETPERPMVILCAAKLGAVRLIDNLIVRN